MQARKTVPHTIPFLMTADESFDVGVDFRTGVNDKDYQVPLPFSGTLDKLTYKLAPCSLTGEDQKTFEDPKKAVAANTLSEDCAIEGRWGYSRTEFIKPNPSDCDPAYGAIDEIS